MNNTKAKTQHQSLKSDSRLQTLELPLKQNDGLSKTTIHSANSFLQNFSKTYSALYSKGKSNTQCSPKTSNDLMDDKLHTDSSIKRMVFASSDNNNKVSSMTMFSSKWTFVSQPDTICKQRVQRRRQPPQQRRRPR